MTRTPTKLGRRTFSDYFTLCVGILLRLIGKGFDCFISYSHTDGKHLAKFFARRLSTAGFRCCLDETTFAPELGRSLPTAIKRKVARSSMVLLICTTEARCSEWVGKEIGFGRFCRLDIVPVDVAGAFTKTDGAWRLEDVFLEDLPKNVYVLELPASCREIGFKVKFREAVAKIRAKRIGLRQEKRFAAALSVVCSIILLLAGFAALFLSRASDESRLRGLREADSHLTEGDAAVGLADFAWILHQRPTERAAAERIVNTLWNRIFLLPVSTDYTELTPSREARLIDGDNSPDGRFRLSCPNPNSIAIQDNFDKGIVWSITNAHRLVIRDLRWASDNRHFVSASADNTAIVWDLISKTNLPSVNHPEAVYCADFNPASTRLVTGCRDKAIRLWNADGMQIWESKQQAPVASVRFNGEGTLIVAVCDDGVIRLWKADTGSPYSELLRIGAEPEEACFTRDGHHIKILMTDGSNRVFKVTSLRSPRSPFFPQAQAPTTEVTERHVRATIVDDKTVEVKNTLRTVVLSHKSTVNCVRLSVDGLRIVTSIAKRDNNHRARVWDVQTGLGLTDWLECPEPVPSIWFSQDGHSVLSESASWEIYVAKRPTPEWLMILAEAVAGETNSGRRVSGPWSAGTFNQLRNTLAPWPSTNELINWAKEFIRDDFPVLRQ